MKKIMIVGAGRSQIPAIITAKKMGLVTIAIDGNPDAPGLKLADFPEVVSTNDSEGAIKIAKKYAIDGVLTIATDSGVVSTANVAQYLGFVGITPKTAEMATDKSLMKERLTEKGVPGPDFGVAYSIEDAQKIINRVGFPVVIKPVDSAGSIGVKKVRNSTELEVAFEYAKSISHSGKVIIEELMEGPEVSVETLTFKGITNIVAITDKITSPPPYCVEMGHTIPSNLPEDMQKQICHVTKKGLQALRIDYSGGHTEIKITEDGPKIIEIGARLGGWIAADMVPLSTGVDMVKESINIAMGNEPNFKQKFSRGAALRVITSKAGKVSYIKGEDKVKKAEGIIISEIYIDKGDVINPLRSGFDRIGRVVAVGQTREIAVQRAESAIKLLEVEVV
jgi:biotin carboxylase